MSRWFRHYAGMMRDEKLVRVAVKSKQTVERVVWVWGAILESASEINDNGRYEFDAGEAAYFLRCDDDDILSIIVELETAGRLAQGMVARWSDRQYSSDSSRERQRQYRERRANAPVHIDDDHHNGDVTPPSRDGDVTPQDTRDREQIQKDANASSKREIEREFNESFWPVYPLHVGKPNALKAYFAARKRAGFEAIMAGARRYAAERAGEDKQFTKQAQGWLSRDGWNDEPKPAIRATSPPGRRKPNAFDAYDEIAQMKGWNDEPASLPGANQDAERLPAVSSGPSGPLVDLRRGHDWHPGSGDN